MRRFRIVRKVHPYPVDTIGHGLLYFQRTGEMRRVRLSSRMDGLCSRIHERRGSDDNTCESENDAQVHTGVF